VNLPSDGDFVKHDPGSSASPLTKR
jgi:hypothetical protein